MTPLEQYQHDLQEKKIVADSAQQNAVVQLERIYQALVFKQRHSKLSFLNFKQKALIKGLYMWGGVGRGKTYLMDLFFNALPFKNKCRLHFHQFMAKVHRELRMLQGHKNPLEVVASQWAKQFDILCFDEFVVIDIADAMILSLLLETLFIKGVTLMATSNVPPRDLYKEGIQRQRFLPAIALLQQHTQILNVDSGTDYRVQNKKEKYRYLVSLENESPWMCDHFIEMSGGKVPQAKKLSLLGRTLSCLGMENKVVWFDYATLCQTPRASEDYLELAARFKVLLLSGVLQMDSEKDNEARRFINLIDVLYDAHVQLIISAQVPVENLYTGSRLAFEFERTKSRLWEMQSPTYWGKS